MKLKKIVLFALVLSVALIAVFTFSACGKDEPSPVTSGRLKDNTPSTSAVNTTEDGERTSGQITNASEPVVTAEPAVSTEPVITTELVVTAEPPVTTEPPVTEPKTTAPKATEPPTTSKEKPKTEPPVVQDDPITVSFDAVPVNPGETYTGLEPLDNIKFTVYDPKNKAGYSTENKHFSYGIAKNGEPHSITVRNQKYFDSLGRPVLAWDNKTPTEEKVLYLTFDCGVENKGLTDAIIDILKEKGIKTTFFCTLDYIKSDPQVVAKMIREGHNVGNHSVSHLDYCKFSKEKAAQETLGVHNYLRVNFGYESKYFRYPFGYYTENTVALLDSFGYRQVFWSIAHVDYNDNDQPSYETAMAQLTGRLHPGAVILLHTSSTTNKAILSDYIDYCIGHGYTFRTLDEYDWPENN